MDIECKLKREGGSLIPLDNVTYHFAPREDGAHVAAVTIEAHQERFLSITEAYRLYRGSAAALEPAAAPVDNPSVAPAQAPAADTGIEILLGSSTHPATFDIHGKTWQLGDVVVLAQKASGLDVAEWNELEEETRASLIDDELDKLEADTNGDGTVDQSEERAALAAEYKAKFGKAPASRLSAAKIREALAAQ